MLNLSSKEYDLNTLFSFESLKEILIELAKSQIKLENEITNINIENGKRDKKMVNFQKILNNYKVEINFNKQKDNNENNVDIEDNYNEIENENNDIEEDNDNNENENEINIINQDNISITEKEKNSEKETANNNLEEKINSEKKEKDEKEKEKNETTKKGFIKKTSSIIQNEGNNISKILVRKMTKQIKANKTKIDLIEEKIKNEITNKLEEEKNKIKENSKDYENELKLVNDKINSLISKDNDIEQKIEMLQSNTKALDIMTMFKDDGSGTIDATKVMVKALQEKVFKKFELVETRHKKESMENFKTKTSLDNLIPKIDKIVQDLEKTNQYNDEKKEEFDSYKKNNEEINIEIKKSLTNDINNKVEQLKQEINTDIKNKISAIEEKLNNINLKEMSNNNNGLEKENLKIFDKKILDLRKKTNDIENTLKLHLKKNEIEAIRNELKDVTNILESKLSKEDIKELYNYHLEDLDEINDVKDRLEINNEEISKINNAIRTALQKIEIFQGNLILLQSSSGNPSLKKVVDFSKYVDNHKLNETANPIIKQIENIHKENESIRRDMNEIENIIKEYSKNAIKKFEDENTNKMNELKILIQKKYVEKYDFNRTIKSLEVQIKALNEEHKRRDADTWLLAKKNTQCFNCASCDANIKNENYTTADYLAWKKYPKGEKIHRMGQGFSHMLEMMSSEFAKSIERNEFYNENDSNNINTENNMYISTAPDKMERASSTKLKINQKHLIQDENIQDLKNSKKSGKMKLPKMVQSKMKLKKNDNISANHNSDDENSIEGNIIKNTLEKEKIQNINGSPKIMKIIKKTKNDLNSSSTDNFRTIKDERNRIDKDKNF